MLISGKQTIRQIVACVVLCATTPAFSSGTTLYSSNKLSGISNAVLCNGDTYVAFTEEAGVWSGYPDGNVSGNNLKLLAGKKVVNVDKSGMPDVAGASSIACDSLNQVHLAYQKWAGFSYAFASPYFVFNGSNTVSNNSIFENANWGWFTTLDVDSRNKAHVIQFAHSGYFLNYSTNAGGNWINDDISGSGTYYGSPTIAVDSADRSHVMAFSTTGTANVLRHWHEDESGNWSQENVAQDAAGLGNLVFDPRVKDTAYAVYLTTGDEVMLLTMADGVWSKEQVGVEKLPNVQHMMSVAISLEGKLYIVVVVDNRDVRLYTKDTGGWIYYPIGKYAPPANVRVVNKAPTILFGSGGPVVVYNAGTKIVKATLNGVKLVR